MPDGAALFWLVVLAGGIAIFVALVMRRKSADEARREEKAVAYEEHLRKNDEDRSLRDLDRYFPALAPRWKQLVEEGADVAEAFHQAVDETPGVVVGRAFGVPALLVNEERRKHLYVTGRTGSGKTTLLLNLINADLKAGHGVGVIAPEGDLFRDWLLPLVPDERIDDVIYFAPGDPKSRITFNPLSVEDGDDKPHAAEELLSIFKRSVGEDEIGARMAPILGNAFALLTGRPGATLWDVKRLVEDVKYREEVAATAEDEYVREFWLKTYSSFPKGSHVPIVNRLDRFLRPPAVRAAVCHPMTSFSLRRVLAEGQILLVDLSRLPPDSMMLLGEMLLSKFQVELMRREALQEEDRTPFYLYVDEFGDVGHLSEDTWRALLSRGRRRGLALTLAHQHPTQIAEALHREIVGNAASLIAFASSAKDAESLRKEFLECTFGGDVRPVGPEAFVTLKQGKAIARLGTGAFAIPLKTDGPFDKPPAWHGEKVKEASWHQFGASPFDKPLLEGPDRRSLAAEGGEEDYLE